MLNNYKHDSPGTNEKLNLFAMSGYNLPYKSILIKLLIIFLFILILYGLIFKRGILHKL